MAILAKLGILITIRGCQWDKIKETVTKRSPYSLFFYEKVITTSMILSAVENGQFFGLLEVNLVTPNWLQEQCNRINFATIFNKISPTREMLGNKMLEQCDIKGTKFPLNSQLTLVYNADNYMITSTMLQFYLKLGIRVTNLHYCIEYQKARPLKKFIQLSKFFAS